MRIDIDPVAHRHASIHGAGIAGTCLGNCLRLPWSEVLISSECVIHGQVSGHFSLGHLAAAIDPAARYPCADSALRDGTEANV